MTIKERFKETAADIESILVMVTEVDDEEHPPKSKTWNYDHNATIENFNFPRMYFDRTTDREVEFDITSPVRRTLALRKGDSNEKLVHRAELRAYHNDKGRSIIRSFNCEITFIEPPQTSR